MNCLNRKRCRTVAFVKIACLVIFVSWFSVSGAVANASEYSVRIGTGIVSSFGSSYGDNENMESETGVPIFLSAGYFYSDWLRLNLELQYWSKVGFGYRDGIGIFGSFIVDYYLTKKEIGVELYILSGIGLGYAVFIRDDDPDSEPFMGPVQLQGGLGINVPIVEWLAIGLEGRIRWGIPLLIDVFSFSALIIMDFSWDM